MGYYSGLDIDLQSHEVRLLPGGSVSASPQPDPKTWGLWYRMPCTGAGWMRDEKPLRFTKSVAVMLASEYFPMYEARPLPESPEAIDL